MNRKEKDFKDIDYTNVKTEDPEEIDDMQSERESERHA